MSLPQPVPPSWKDLGKSSSDLLTKDFPFSGTSIEVKTVTPNNVAFRVAGHQDKAGAIAGEVEGKYTDKARGVVFTQAWTTANTLRTTVELENQVARGLKFEANTSLVPNKGSTSALVSAIYKQPGFHGRAFLDFFKGPTFTADTVLGHDGIVLGAEASYNVTEGKVTKYAAAVGYSGPEYAVALHGLSNCSTFSASYYHRVSPDVEAGAKAIYDTKSTTGGVHLEVGAKAYLDQAAFLKAKINNCGIITFGYTQSLRPGVRASFGLALDSQRLNESSPVGPAHKVGISVVFEG